MNALGLLVPPAQTLRASVGLLVLRVFAGYAFMVHGWPKIQAPFSWGGAEMGIPGFFRALAALSEFGGGLAWILGLLTPLASAGLVCTMAVATWFHVGKLGHPLVANVPPPTGELPALFFCVAVLLLLAGPGRFSADAKLFREKTA
jgi:putative oxidoreductase